MRSLRKDAMEIVTRAIREVLPEQSVIRALEGHTFPGRIFVVAIGKAAWRMASAAGEFLGDRITSGVVITKYGHSQGDIRGMKVYEAGHPLPDEKTIHATSEALSMVKDLRSEDTVLFLVSGGGSALFEKPLEGVTLVDFIDITDQFLACGADIVEINTVRKRFSSVKGGRFAELVKPGMVFSIVLSDVLGDRLDSIASGPAYPDSSTAEEALSVVNRYDLKMSPSLLDLLKQETPKQLDNVKTVITGSVRVLCEKARKAAEDLGYGTLILTTTLDCEAREAGSFVAALAREEALHGAPLSRPCALILGGETVVHVRGKGMGGRNQELALSAAEGIAGLEDVVVISVGSDGTDGPNDAAGGLVGGKTVERLKNKGLSIQDYLENSDSYHALTESGDLIKTGPTGTNVNDITLVLCR
jgi:hydroxypyruvate reductase